MTQPLFLIGPRGCGMALADSLNRRFVDTDQWLQSQLNMTVAEIVEREEWAGFRARETAALEAVTAPSTVIATGGGIILTEFNRHFMQNNGIVVYLCAPVSVLVNGRRFTANLNGKTAERRSSGSAGRTRCAISRSCAYYHRRNKRTQPGDF